MAGGIENLTPWQPGQSGNPAGRPKSKPVKEALLRVLREAGDDQQALDDAARAFLKTVTEGDVSAFRELADRLDGKVPQGTGQDDELGPQEHVIRWQSSSTSSPTSPGDSSSNSTTAQSASPASSATGEPEKP